MKRRGGLIFVSLLLSVVLALSLVSAASTTNSVATSNQNNFWNQLTNLWNKLTGKAVSSTPGDLTPRIAYWYGKVNQHIENGVWTTDPDGSSGANLNMLTYCKKWYPDTVSVKPYKNETISTWRDAGNTGGPYTSTKTSYACVQKSADSSGNWTQWFNHDDPSGNGDFELLQDHPGVCGNLSVVGIQCQTTDGVPASQTGQTVVVNKSVGCYCYNSQNPNGCDNYEVRFECGVQEDNVIKCVDTDGGLNYYTKGKITSGLLPYSNHSITPSDSVGDVCAWQNNAAYAPGSPVLFEQYCANSTTEGVQKYTCPFGCYDGACLNSNETKPLNSSCANGVCTIYNSDYASFNDSSGSGIFSANIFDSNSAQVEYYKDKAEFTSMISQGETYKFNNSMKIQIKNIVFAQTTGAVSYVVFNYSSPNQTSPRSYCTPSGNCTLYETDSVTYPFNFEGNKEEAKFSIQQYGVQYDNAFLCSSGGCYTLKVGQQYRMGDLLVTMKYLVPSEYANFQVTPVFNSKNCTFIGNQDIGAKTYFTYSCESGGYIGNEVFIKSLNVSAKDVGSSRIHLYGNLFDVLFNLGMNQSWGTSAISLHVFGFTPSSTIGGSDSKVLLGVSGMKMPTSTVTNVSNAGSYCTPEGNCTLYKGDTIVYPYSFEGQKETLNFSIDNVFGIWSQNGKENVELNYAAGGYGTNLVAGQQYRMGDQLITMNEVSLNGPINFQVSPITNSANCTFLNQTVDSGEKYADFSCSLGGYLGNEIYVDSLNVSSRDVGSVVFHMYNGNLFDVKSFPQKLNDLWSLPQTGSIKVLGFTPSQESSDGSEKVIFEITGVHVPTTTQKEAAASQCTNGCSLNGNCYNFGYRINQTYCSQNGFVNQLADNSVCQNDFECSSNVCINSQCVSSSVWNKFLNWFQNIFG